MDQFSNMLVHHWHNLKQAQLAPASFAYVHYLWYWEDGVLHTKQWYDYQGQSQPYRARTHKLIETETSIILETYNGDEKSADTIWTQTPDGWVGQTEKGWISKEGVEIDTQAKLTKDEFITSDKGRKDGQLLWGSEKGPFRFTKCTR